MELEWELDVDLGAGMGAAVELLYNTRYRIPAIQFPLYNPRYTIPAIQSPLGLLQNAILAQNGVSGPWRPFR